MVKKGVDSGEYIWHTVNSLEASRYDGIEFNDDIADAAAEVGERIYRPERAIMPSLMVRIQ